MKLSTFVRFFSLSFVFLVIPAFAAAQQSITCEANNENRKYCGSYSPDQVRLDRQISGSPCIEGRTWGVDREGLWVEQGCRAVFTIRTREGYDRDRNRDYGDQHRDDRDRGGWWSPSLVPLGRHAANGTEVDGSAAAHASTRSPASEVLSSACVVASAWRVWATTETKSRPSASLAMLASRFSTIVISTGPALPPVMMSPTCTTGVYGKSADTPGTTASPPLWSNSGSRLVCRQGLFSVGFPHRAAYDAFASIPIEWRFT